MRRILCFLALVLAASGCQTRMPDSTPPAGTESVQDFFLVFFRPASAELTEAAQAIVRQAARNALTLPATRVEISVPPDAPGRALIEERFTAIQNILSASGVDVRLLQRVSLSAMAAQLPGGADRAEIRLVREGPVPR